MPLIALAYFAISLLASVVGAICGIGGGVIIKPTLDLFHLDSVATVSFLSGCTVLAMSCYSVTKSMRAGDSKIDLKMGTPLAIGAAIGGVVGKQMFSVISARFNETAGAVQAGCLFLITLATMIYTINKKRIHTKQIDKTWVSVVIGLLLGIMSSFLGIGGGPINLVVFYYFFSMDTKAAAQNSLYVILISQVTSLVATLVTGSVPVFSWLNLILMVVGGILGGMLGRMANKKMDNAAVDKLFLGLMCVIMAISVYNVYQYISL